MFPRRPQNLEPTSMNITNTMHVPTSCNSRAELANSNTPMVVGNAWQINRAAASKSRCTKYLLQLVWASANLLCGCNISGSGIPSSSACLFRRQQDLSTPLCGFACKPLDTQVLAQSLWQSNNHKKDNQPCILLQPADYEQTTGRLNPNVVSFSTGLHTFYAMHVGHGSWVRPQTRQTTTRSSRQKRSYRTQLCRSIVRTLVVVFKCPCRAADPAGRAQGFLIFAPFIVNWFDFLKKNNNNNSDVPKSD